MLIVQTMCNKIVLNIVYQLFTINIIILFDPGVKKSDFNQSKLLGYFKSKLD